MNFSVVVGHTPWRPERVTALEAMMGELDVNFGSFRPMLLNNADYRGWDWQEAKVEWARGGWEFAANCDVTHCLFLTDDLHLAPNFWGILKGMVAAVPNNPIGLLSNHPAAYALYKAGFAWYRTNSWLVGPAYVLPRNMLRDGFLPWFKSLPAPRQRYFNDDSAINEWVTNHGPGATYHPIPTCIEHRIDIDSTVGHGDRYSRERISWREVREIKDDGERWAWLTHPLKDSPIVEMADAGFWTDTARAPMLPVG